MAEILIHTEKISDEVREKLLAADVIPIRVKNMDNFKLISAERRLIGGDDIMVSALEALSTDLNKFGDHRLNKFISSLVQSAQRGRQG